MQKIKQYHKIAIIPVILMLVILPFLLFYIYKDAISLVKEQFNEQQQLITRQTVVSIREDMKILVHELEELSERTGPAIGDLSQVETHMKNTFEQVKSFGVNDVGYLNAEGIVKKTLFAHQLEGKDFSYRQYFKQAKTFKEYLPAYEFITFRGVEAGQKGIIIAMPVLTSEGLFGGVVLITMKAHKFISNFVPKPTDGVRFIVVEVDGNVLFHPEYTPDVVLGELSGLDISFKKFLKKMDLNDSGVAEYISTKGIKTLAAFSTINVAGQIWKLIVEAPEREVSKLLISFSIKNTIITLIVVMVVIGVSVGSIHFINKTNFKLELEIADRKRDEEMLQRVQEELEASVEKRTIELKGTNEQLQTEINEHRKAEKELEKARDEQEEQAGNLRRTNKLLKTLYKELEQNNIKLQEMDKLKSGFVSMVSHELRTPLTAIKEGIALVSEGTVGNIDLEQKDLLDTAGRNVDRLKRIVNDVLDYQKLEAGKQEFRMEENHINDTVKEAVKVMNPLIRSKGLKINVALQKYMPKVFFDRDRILQVLINIINNAVLHNVPNGSITVSSSFERLENIICVSIADTGIGIKKEDVDRLFKSFSQLSVDNRRVVGRTGLGLAISKKIMEKHNGKITIESEFGKGSIFSMQLPIQELIG